MKARVELPAGTWPCPACGQPVRSGDDARACASCGEPLVVCGSYRIVGHLGHTVYRGVRTTDDHPVAIKILAPPDDDDWTAWELFERSCKVLEQLEHPALPKVHAFERTEKGRLVLVRETFEGGTLEERVKDRDERLSPERAEELLEDLLELLVYLHGRVPPVIHRDIKPSNIMFRKDDSDAPVLVDFDTIVSRRSGLTIVGTPGYAPPEQFAAEAVPASDVYGVGTTMLFVATHVEPDDLPRVDGRFDVAGRLASLDDGVRRVLLKMIEPDLSKRYASARAALDELHALEHEPEHEPKPEHVHEHEHEHEPEHEHGHGHGHERGRGKRRRAREARARAAAAAPKPVAPKPPPPAPKTDATPDRRRGTSTRSIVLSALLAVGFLVIFTLDRCGTSASRARKVVAATATATSTATSTAKSASAIRDENAVLAQACNDGAASSCFDLAQRWDNGSNGVKKDRARALTFYELGCAKNDGASCNNLGYAYGKPDGKPQDYEKAAELYEKSCSLKDAIACKNLALLWAEGDLGPKDPKKVLELRGRACDLADGEACNDVGVMYEKGDGVRADVRQAASYYGLACDHGDAWGCRNYGFAFRDGQGVEKDDRRAVALFRRACDGKEEDGCFRLGEMLEVGRGTDKDPVRAGDLYATACAADVKGACDAVARLVAKDARVRGVFEAACDAGVDRACGDLARKPR